MTERRPKNSDSRKDAPGGAQEKQEKDREDAPETETPEFPKVSARVVEKASEKAATRDVPLETPERPVQPPLRQERISAPSAGQPAPAVAIPTPTHAPIPPVVDEITELQRHVAQCPVDAHAPAWLGRVPNSL